MAELYRPLYLNRSPIVTTDRRTAELIKYAANAFLATKITFINEIADLCEKVGPTCRRWPAHRLDNRIGGKFLHAARAMAVRASPRHAGADQDRATLRGALRIVETVASVNEIRKRAMARKVVAALGTSLRGKTVAVLGLTFKPNTDDMRDAPSIPLITALHDQGAKGAGLRSDRMEQAKKVLPELTYCGDAYQCRQGRACAGHRHGMGAVRALDLDRLKQVMAEKPAIVRSAQHLFARRDAPARLHL